MVQYYYALDHSCGLRSISVQLEASRMIVSQVAVSCVKKV